MCSIRQGSGTRWTDPAAGASLRLSGNYYPTVTSWTDDLEGTYRSYFGCSVCAIITWRLNSSTMFGSSRTDVGFLASVMVSILSCSLSSE